MFIIDGKKIGSEIRAEVKKEVDIFLATYRHAPTLAVVFVGDHPASSVYVRNKHKACEEVGIRSLSVKLPDDVSEEELLTVVEDLNTREDVHGILVQLPLPRHIDESKVIHAISPVKDVDGFHPFNIGNLLLGEKGFVPCTPAGIIELLDRYNLPIEGKHAVVVGRSNIVGKPIAQLLLKRNATVTVCHSKTKDLADYTSKADILVVAIGKANFIHATDVKPGAVVIDVGINRNEEGKLCGDVDFASVSQVASSITPVPGGVGPMTIAMLMKNTLLASKMQIEAKK